VSLNNVLQHFNTFQAQTGFEEVKK